NGSGKSNYIDALCLVRDALLYGLDRQVDERGSIRALRARKAHNDAGDLSIDLDLLIDNSPAHYGFSLQNTQNNDYIVNREICQIGSERYVFQQGSLIETSNESIKKEAVVHNKALALPVFRSRVSSNLESLF